MKKRILSGVLMFVLVATMLVGYGASAAPKASSFKGSLKGVTLNVGTSGTYAPFSYYKNDGKTLQGFDIEFLKSLQSVLGFKISNNALQAMDYGPLATSVSQGKLDIAAAALCATSVRKKTMNFTNTYYDAGIVVVVAKNNNKIKSVNDLKSGKYKVSIQTGTVAYQYASENLPQDCIQSFDSQALAYKAVEGGQADATIYDAPGTAYSIKTGAIKLKIVGKEFYNGQAPYAIALSFSICKKYPNIVKEFNSAIAYLTSNGTMAKLKKKWCQ
jgi:ABC-type amino acid transport/signal transduction systems, periplasmic component/domain